MNLTDYYELEEKVKMLEKEIERLDDTVKRLKYKHECYVSFASVFARKTRDLLLYLGLTEKDIASWYGHSK